MSNKKSPVLRTPPAQGYDASGHMDPKHAQRLLELAREGRVNQTEAGAFIDGSKTEDDLAEGLAEAAVVSMTTGEDRLGDDFEGVVAEESGGPFIETSGNTEFAGGTDESNIAEATREPFPKT